MFAATTYTIKQGDTLGKLASQYGINIGDISGYKSGDPNKIFAGETVSFNTRDIPPVNNISATNLGQQPYQAPPTVPKTGYAGLIESTNAAITSLTPDVKKGEQDIKDVYDRLGDQSRRKQGLYEDEGVYEKQKTYNDLTNTINAKDLAYRRKVEKIQEENPNGMLESGQQIAVNQVERDWAREKADLSIAAAFARDDYALAKSIVDDKVTAETEDLTTQLAGLQYFYSQNYSRLDDSQKSLLQQQTAQVEQELADKKELLQTVGSVQLEAAKAGAPASVITAIGRATDITSAIAAGGKYIGLLDRQKASSGGSGGNIKFTDTQVSNGATAAGVPLSTFQGYDKDTQNFFITGAEDAKKIIDDELKGGTSVEDVKAAIGQQQVSAPVQQYLQQYADKSGKQNASLTPEQTTQTLVSTFKSLQTGGYSKKEAKNAVISQLSDGGKSPLPGTLSKSIRDASKEVYGKNWLGKLFSK